jgi:hypothetical protein
MNQQLIAQPLGLIEPNSLGDNEIFLFELRYEMFPDEKFYIYKKNLYFVILIISWNPLKKIWAGDQVELPFSSLLWIVDRFENGFFKPQDQGGVSDFERSLRKEFDGELIGINSMAHCCAENLPGFNIWNGSRKSYIARTTTQQWDIPRYMLLEQGLLAKLKDLAVKYNAGLL